MPSWTITSGIRANGGSARRKLTIGLNMPRTTLNHASANPTGTASVQPIAMPISTRSTLSRVSSSSPSLVVRPSTRVSRTVPGCRRTVVQLAETATTRPRARATPHKGSTTRRSVTVTETP